MKVEINGVKFEGVSVDEALELIEKSKLKKKSLKTRKNVKWTDEETAIIRKHNTLPAKKLWKLIKKTHSLNSVSFKKRKEKKYAS